MTLQANTKLLADLVPAGSRVLDLGCGNGEMLAYLCKQKNCTGYGVEINPSNIEECVQRGINVLQLNLEEGLQIFEDNSFDVVLQINTLQNIRNLENTLKETARVGHQIIASLPNFAHWPNRLSIFKGRMPVTRALPYEWYDTPNIRVGTFADFEILAQRHGLQVQQKFGLHNGKRINFLPNLRASLAVFHFKH